MGAAYLLRSNLIAIIEQAHGATPTAAPDIGVPQIRLLAADADIESTILY